MEIAARRAQGDECAVLCSRTPPGAEPVMTMNNGTCPSCRPGDLISISMDGQRARPRLHHLPPLRGEVVVPRRRSGPALLGDRARRSEVGDLPRASTVAALRSVGCALVPSRPRPHLQGVRRPWRRARRARRGPRPPDRRRVRRLVRAPRASRSAGTAGSRSPELAAALTDGITSRGVGRRSISASPPPTCSTSRRDRSTCPGDHAHGEPQPEAVQRAEVLPRGRQARSARTPGSRDIRALVEAACPRPAAARGDGRARATCSTPTSSTCCRSWTSRDAPAHRRRPTPRTGWAGSSCPAVLERLPVTLHHLFPELDGTFPNHPADPIDPENQRDLKAAVLEHGADVGLAFDGDADRVFLIDEQAQDVSGSLLTALVASRDARARARREDRPQPDLLLDRPGGRSASTAASPSAPGSVTRSSSRSWPRPARSSAASTPGTTTSATTTGRTPG